MGHRRLLRDDRAGDRPFGIGLTIVEPGATPTGFGDALTAAPIMPEYDRTPADPQKITQAMVDLVDSKETPLRLPLGSDTYEDVRAALVVRLAEHDAHRDVAFSVGRGDSK